MHDHQQHEENDSRTLPALTVCFVLLLSGLIFEFLRLPFFDEYVRIAWYGAAYIVAGFSVIKKSVEYILKGEVFTEFFLMSLATVCAFAIGEYPEAVAVVLFYRVGEYFQDMAVRKAQGSIEDLIDARPDEVAIVEDGVSRIVKAVEVAPGTEVFLKPGEKLALDGVLISERASFNTSALTGESKPRTLYKGETVLAGMINLNTPAAIVTHSGYEDSKLSRILELVQRAIEQKSPTELFIRKFARYYTPAVVLVAALVVILPALLTEQYVFSDWLYRALVFLVVSCPCALVISIPLSYFGGIGAASRNGILFKGSNYLDLIASAGHVVMDKTGTLTEGVFEVRKTVIRPEFDEKELLRSLNRLESFSTHPVATAIAQYTGTPDKNLSAKDVEEIAGHGLKGNIGGRQLLAGNAKWMDKHEIDYAIRPEDRYDTVIALAVDGEFAGYITIADRIKDDARQAIASLKRMGVRTTVLSGDKAPVVRHVAEELGVDESFGDLLPEDKVERIQEFRREGKPVVFVGDGVNDAPVIAISDAGIAMGGLGSDAAIEIADIVIQNDEPSKIPLAIRIGRETRKIVWQNIYLALGVKFLVLLLGVAGVATMWEAVFADVGVALLAILNAVRLQRMKF